MRFRFGTITFTEDYDSYGQWLRTAESLGYELLGYGDSQSLWADVHVSLAFAAQQTATARLGSFVTNPMTRHPAVTAGAFTSLQKLSGGRMVLGIGTGDSALLNIGERPATLAYFERYCRTVKALCAGETAEWSGRELHMHWPVERVPLWMAAEGPKMLHLAGQIADGVVLASGLSPEIVTDTIARIRAGAESAGRSIDDIELWWLVKPYMAPTERDGWRDLLWTLAGSANHVFRFTLDDKFVPAEHREGLLRLQREYAADTHARPERGAYNASLIEKYGLTEWLGRRFLLTGPPELIAERLREAHGYGATNFFLTQMVTDRIGFMHALEREVLSLLR